MHISDRFPGLQNLEPVKEPDMDVWLQQTVTATFNLRGLYILVVARIAII